MAIAYQDAGSAYQGTGLFAYQVVDEAPAGAFQQIMVRGNSPNGKDDYIETWFG